MKVPTCFFCGKDFRSEYSYTGGGGRLVRFRDFVPLPKDVAGHPRGVEWFCNAHAGAAEGLAGLDVASAMCELQSAFPDVLYLPVNDPSMPRPDAVLWITDVGPNRGRVFAIIREYLLTTPAETKAMLDIGTCSVARGGVMLYRGLQEDLNAAGATTEIRYE